MSCNSEVDLQIYLSGPGAMGRRGERPPTVQLSPPLRSTTASVACSSSPDTYSYRSETLGTILASSTSTGTAVSDVLNVKCL